MFLGLRRLIFQRTRTVLMKLHCMGWTRPSLYSSTQMPDTPGERFAIKQLGDEQNHATRSIMLTSILFLQ